MKLANIEKNVIIVTSR